MKASTLVLIMLFGMMSFTGFGSTTADLTENSNLETLMDSPEVSISVVSVATPEVAPVILSLSKDNTPVTLSMYKGITADVISNESKILIDQYRATRHTMAVPPDLLMTALVNPTQPVIFGPPAIPESETNVNYATGPEKEMSDGRLQIQ